MTHSRFSAFTLIELLVVITIIVVLLALLTPALDRAIYQAELAVCGANLHAIGGGVRVYAMNHRRVYPPNFTVEGPQFSDNALDGLFTPAPVAPPEMDRRKLLKPYVSVNGAFNDPLSEAVDLETSNEAWVNGSPANLFGYKFHGEGVGGAGMNKLGDRWSFTNVPDDGKTRKFRVLSYDEDIHLDEDVVTQTTHPDKDGTLTNIVWNSEFSAGGGSTLPMNIPGMANAEFIRSKWRGPYERGDIDMNAAIDDGSVERFNDVAWDAGSPDPDNPGATNDERFTRVPRASHLQDYSQGYNNVPLR